MRVFGTRVNFQFFELAASQAVFGEHALDRHPDDFRRFFLEQFARRDLLETAHVARMPVIDFFIPLGARHGYLFGIDDDDEISRIRMGCKDGFVLSPKTGGNLTGEPPRILSSASTTYHFLSTSFSLATKVFIALFPYYKNQKQYV